MKYKKKFIVVVLFMLVTAAGMKLCMEQKTKELSSLQRPDVEAASDYRQMEVQLDGEDQPFFIDLEIMPKVYKEKHAQEMFAQAYEQIQKQLLGESKDCNVISKDIYLPMTIEGYPLRIAWYSSDSTVLSGDGQVHNLNFSSEERKDVTLTLYMTYEEYMFEKELAFVVVKAQEVPRETLQREIQETLQHMQENEIGEDTFMLPDTLYGKKVTYREKKDNSSFGFFILLVILAGIAFSFKRVEEQKKQMRLRKEQMRYDYAEIVSKLTLLAGAGMTMHRAWEKIVHDYGRQVTETGKMRYAYDEMQHTLYEFQNGISEKQAYDSFGRRCDVKEYRKLASILAQNVKKGSKDVLKLLEEESAMAFQEHKNLARKKGEEAGTKLLFPMFLMLAIVMVIVMVPALLAFSL